MSVIRDSIWGITRGTLFGQHVLASIWMIMTGGSFKIILNWASQMASPPCSGQVRGWLGVRAGLETAVIQSTAHLVEVSPHVYEYGNSNALALQHQRSGGGGDTRRSCWLDFAVAGARSA